MALARYFAEQKRKSEESGRTGMIETTPNQVLPPKMVHELLTPEECNELIQFFKEHPHLKGVGDGSDYTGIRFMHIHNQYFRDMILG